MILSHGFYYWGGLWYHLHLRIHCQRWTLLRTLCKSPVAEALCFSATRYKPVSAWRVLVRLEAALHTASKAIGCVIKQKWTQRARAVCVHVCVPLCPATERRWVAGSKELREEARLSLHYNSWIFQITLLNKCMPFSLSLALEYHFFKNK